MTVKLEFINGEPVDARRKNRRIELTFEDWVTYGMAEGWVGPAVCYTHDGLPMSAEEVDEFEEGDPCISIIRLYNDLDHKEAVEREHSPSLWRK